jgi:hypothetical protein
MVRFYIRLLCFVNLSKEPKIYFEKDQLLFSWDDVLSLGMS